MPIPLTKTRCQEIMTDLQNSISDYVSRNYARHCLEISRIIDYSIAKREVPDRCDSLSSFIKQACRIKINTHHQQAALMVLLISAKSACLMGWFSIRDTRDLFNLAIEIERKFETDLKTKPSQSSLSVISTIMARFYPRMKMDRIFGFLEVKSGYHNYARDFQILKGLRFSPVDKLRLFVVQTDNIETSSCLITPARVDFFLNGVQVVGRNSSSLDSGPQLPTDITPLMKCGSNVLQASGDFNGNYIVAVAFMSELPKPDNAFLQDYEHAPATMDADCVVIERPSQISLNCPISFGRIRTPVKGRYCKHIACFDFDNYVEINSRRPHWRCPSCNKPTCFSDIRLDQTMDKVLKGADPNVSTITFYPDGSRNPVIEPEDTPSNTVQEVVDLTGDDDDVMNAGRMSLLLTCPNREAVSGSDVGSSSQTVGCGDASQRWAPGSLSEQAYYEYYRQVINLPMWHSEAARSVLGMTPPPPQMSLTRNHLGHPQWE